ncbi:MAG: helicase domain protein, partial [Solirubrobacterales bacterium]|nr:helicase domain protein [Solirubrobacterales bacterium]
MQLVAGRPNVELRRRGDDEQMVVLAFPYDVHIVAVVRGIPHRRFDWDTREWSAPADDWVGVHVADLLARFPELTASPEVETWLAAIDRRWVGRVRTTRHDGRGWWVLETRAGTVPAELRRDAVERDGTVLVPLVH